MHFESLPEGDTATAIVRTTVGADSAVVAPDAFDAVTATRTALPTSRLLSVSDGESVPRIVVQRDVDVRSQSFQLYVKRVGDADHDPVEAFRTWPGSAVPEILGGTRLTGFRPRAASEPPCSGTVRTASASEPVSRTRRER
jgi:hypothetical protein